MFKLYQVLKENKKEILPVNDVYTVQELGIYEFTYSRSEIFGENFVPYIEDVPIDPRYYSISKGNFSTIQNRFFQDYFGFALLSIDDLVIKVNIQIEKLKLSEIEDIIMFLWEREDNVFNNFFSKSALSSKLSNDGADFGLTSKFLNFTNYFLDEFEKLYLLFRNLSVTQLQRKKLKVDYSPNVVTSHSINWIISNIDDIIFDESFRDHPDSITLDEKYGYLEKIETDYPVPNYNLYENRIILGSFEYLIRKLNGLKQEIRRSIDLTEYGGKDFADFRDLKKLPFLKLFEDSNAVLKRLNILFTKYRFLFKNTEPSIQKPRPTNIFLSHLHYRRAYQVIKQGFDYRYNFSGELNLLNIKKLSKLYEVYNLHQILSFFKTSLKIENFTINVSKNSDDGIIDKVIFVSKDLNTKIDVLYDKVYPNNLIQLIRLDTDKGKYYRPDYIINIKHNDDSRVFILDAKYSQYYNVKNRYLEKCMNQYVFNTGFPNERYRKIDSLILLYPGDILDVIADNNNYAPQIKLVISKPQEEHNLFRSLESLVRDILPNNLIRAGNYLKNEI